MKNIGVTGTRNEPTPAQHHQLLAYFIREEGTLHHGDCLGADALADLCAMEGHWYIVVHPPSDQKLRAFCPGNEVRPMKPYLERNRQIVAECDELIAIPGQAEVKRGSGTWATVRYANQAGKKVTVLWPDGTWQHDYWSKYLTRLPS